MKLLVVEDDDSVAIPLAIGLERQGFAVERAATGTEALNAQPADMVLLDLGLPDIDGREICRQLRARSDAPILIITARGEEIDRVIGFELGADDYVVKPFGFHELVARIRAVARRSQGASQHDGTQRLGSLSLNRQTRHAQLADDALNLTPKEFDILALLLDDPGVVVARNEIISRLWTPHWYGPTKTLDVHIAALRKKLGDSTWIETIRGVGFRLREPS